MIVPYCLPSVAVQTRLDFTWLVLFHPQTPEPFRTQISHYQELYPFFLPIYTDVEADINVLVSKIAAQYAGDAEWLLTTRLDNDDMLHRQYVQRLREEIETNPPKVRTFYSFVHGLQIFLKEQAAFQLTFIPNHFLSLLEPVGHPMTALGINHRCLENGENPVRYIRDLNAWGEIVHSTNWVNNYQPGWHARVCYELEDDAFPLSMAPYRKRMRNAGVLIRKYFSFRIQQIHRAVSRLFF